MIAAEFWIVAAGLLGVCFSATGAMALRGFARHELEEYCRRHGRPARLSVILRRYSVAALAAESLTVLLTAALVAELAHSATIQVLDEPESAVRIIASRCAIGMLLLWTACVWAPQAVARLWAVPLVYYAWPLWRLIDVALRPAAVFGRLIDALFHRLAGRVATAPSEESFEDEIRSMVNEGHREGLLEGDAREMIEGVIELRDANVYEVMTPRTDMKSIQVGLGWPETINHVTSWGHTRIPVFDKNRDDVIGVLYVKDLLPELAKPADQPRRSLREILRQPHFVPETKPINALLQEFQRTGNHLAIVLDEYGGVSGLVTIEDVLEEIVGEIIDEYDEDHVEPIRKIDDHTAEALARAHVDEVNQQLGLSLPEDGDFDTIGGFVFSQLGRIPSVGETVTSHDARITVLEVTRRRIERVRIESLATPQPETA